jgi:hypothetical protein
MTPRNKSVLPQAHLDLSYANSLAAMERLLPCRERFVALDSCVKTSGDFRRRRTKSSLRPRKNNVISRQRGRALNRGRGMGVARRRRQCPLSGEPSTFCNPESGFPGTENVAHKVRATSLDLGGDERIRTASLLRAKQALSQLELRPQATSRTRLYLGAYDGQSVVQRLPLARLCLEMEREGPEDPPFATQ